MRKLKFKDDSAAQDRLARAQGAIDDYSAAHPDELSDKEHEEFRSLLLCHGLCFDIHADTGFKGNGKETLENRNLFNNSSDQRFIKCGDFRRLCFNEIVKFCDSIYLLVTLYSLRVNWVNDGVAGVEKFNVAELGYYAAILMDIRMPCMDGIEATKAIRA